MTNLQRLYFIRQLAANAEANKTRIKELHVLSLPPNKKEWLSVCLDNELQPAQLKKGYARKHRYFMNLPHMFHKIEIQIRPFKFIRFRYFVYFSTPTCIFLLKLAYDNKRGNQLPQPHQFSPIHQPFQTGLASNRILQLGYFAAKWPQHCCWMAVRR